MIVTNQTLIDHLSKYPPDSHIAYLILCEDDIIQDIENEHGKETQVTREEAQAILERVQQYATNETGLNSDLIEACHPPTLRKRLSPPPSQI